MITKPLLLAIYESSLLSGAAVPLTDGWGAIAAAYSEPEVISLFSNLRTDFLAGAPSFNPIVENTALKDDNLVACFFAELGANTTMYESAWSDMAIAYLLKQKLKKDAPTEVDVQVAAYLLSNGDGSPEMSLRKEMESWSKAPEWNLPPHPEAYTFPDEWWRSFVINENDNRQPKTMSLITQSTEQTGMAATMLPQTTARWSRFSQAADHVFA